MQDKIITSSLFTDGTIYNAVEGYDALILADMARAMMPDDRVLVHVCLDDARLALMEELLGFFAPDVKTVSFPAWDCLPYDRVSPHGDLVAQRMQALSELIQWDEEKDRYPRILLTTVNAALQKVPPRNVLKDAAWIVTKGQNLDLEGFHKYLAQNGYERRETVREAGEFAVRGGIFDIFPAGYEFPLRLDLFGEEIESIKTFDPMTQRSAETVSGFSLHPVSEFFLNEESIQRFRSGYREAFGVVRDNDPLYEAVSNGGRYNGMEHWLPLFYDRMDRLHDYVPNSKISIDPHVRRARDERAQHITDFYDARKSLNQSLARQSKQKDVSISGSIYNPLPPESLYIIDYNFEQAISLQPHADPNMPETDSMIKKARNFADIRANPNEDLFAALKNHIHNFLSKKTLIAAYSEGSRSRLSIMMENAGIGPLKQCDDFNSVKKLRPGEVGLIILALDHGFTTPDLAVLTETDILGDRLARKTRKSKKADNFLTEVSSLAPGDLIVHMEHGVGRFISLETITVGKTFHDCLQLEYHGGDKLYVPVENMEVLSRYGSDEGTAQLDKLGGAGWQARKAKVKKDLMAIADHLLKIASDRLLRKTDPLQIEQSAYNEFATRFPYHETEDQQRAIDAVIEDLAHDYAMDRLVCGDVGFGKTEVALRAAYVAAMAGVQVAVVVPTTLLARQHTLNFKERFKDFPFRVEQLSRLVHAKDAKATKEGLTDGSVQIVIGTHAILSKDIKFASLGLVIVDEEQRFGVKQKERLKELKANVNVLTLTATPIPRTLQMALTGVKEMSIIATPPVDRLAIRSFVMPMDPVVIKDALMREKYRGGQSFYVVPRIKDLKDIEDMLAELVPDLKTITAHGQLTPDELEDRMTAFYDGQYDILIATNIIESGLDVPRANTMIVHRADMLGLSQLYQIRGRIGRAKVRAYAYLTFKPNIKLNDRAEKRLNVIETLDTLGAGFQLASHDMDIRGAGNLLGEQQSGHIKEVGVELYQHMLEEAVAAAKEGQGSHIPQEDSWSPQINIGTSVLIPEDYVEDLSVRMSLYRRLADISDLEEMDSFAAEMIDRFGELPDEVGNLLDIVTIKQLCKKAGVSHVEAGPKGAVIGFHNNHPPNVEGLMTWMNTMRGIVKLRPDQKMAVMRPWETAAQRVQGVKKTISDLANL